MEIQVNLTKDECNYLLNIVSYYQNEKYKTAKSFYKDKKSFDEDIKFKKKSIKQQIIDVEKFYEKISNKMKGECYE